MLGGGSKGRLLALTSTPARLPALRAQGILPLAGNLDDPASLRRLAALATRVVHLAPPPGEGHTRWWIDPRTRTLLRVLRQRTPPRSLVYGSTSGVYGDCGGNWVVESRTLAPRTPRAQRRVDAERLVRHLGRAAGTPRGRLLKGTPVLDEADDVYTNHIHADDLARACIAALWRGKPQRVVNVNDDSALKMGDYFDQAADLYGLPRPPRVPRYTAQATLPLMLLSFMSESRRMDNTRLKRELRLRLQYPQVFDGLVQKR